MSTSTPGMPNVRRWQCCRVGACHEGAVTLAVDAANKGLFFSVPPPIVYKSEYEEVARAVPLESLLLEADSPPSAPVGQKRGTNSVGSVSVPRRSPSCRGSLCARSDDKCGAVLRNLSSALVEAIERGPAAAVCGCDEKKTARWRRIEQSTNAAAVLPDTLVTAAEAGETLVPEPVPRVLRQGRWRRRGEDIVLDPTVCSRRMDLPSAIEGNNTSYPR